MDTAQLVAKPDGPMKFVAELGCEVGTFTADAPKKTLKYHVPLEMRGDYRPKDLANYDDSKQYRVDAFGKVLCYGFTKAGERCSKRAVNRYPRCDMHGGRIHPLDKVIQDKEDDNGENQSLSRYRQFVAGLLTVDDLDDEELASCGFRATNGRIYKPRNVPRELAQGFTRAIYERAATELRSNTVDAARTVAEIMKNKNVEPDIRLKAALSLIERNLGKTPQVIALTTEKPYEEVFDGIVHSTRDESRTARGIESSRPASESTDSPIDVDVVESDTLGTDATVPKDGVPQPDSIVHSTDATDEFSVNVGDGQRDSGVRDARMFERNEAILAQVIEIKPFEYDLTDHRANIKTATKKRYARRTLDDVPLLTKKEQNADGTWHVIHSYPPVKVASKSATNQRKAYTLKDFGGS